VQLHRVVARVEDEHGSNEEIPLLHGRPPREERPDLLRGDLVGVPCGVDALRVHGGGPTLAEEVELGDELVAPSGDDWLAGGVARGMVVEASLGTTLGVAAGPHAHVDGVDVLLVLGRRGFLGEQVA